MRLGMSGVNLMLPAASTLLEAVTTAARAAILPDGVSTRRRGCPGNAVGGRRQRQRHLLTEFRNQRAQPLTTTDRGIAILRADLVANGDIFQILAGETGAEDESDVSAQSPRSFGSAEAHEKSNRREASSMARLARTRAARNSSVSPARALRRPMRIFWPEAR